MGDPTVKVRESVLGITPYVPGRPAAQVERELGVSGVIKLASNENPLGPSPKAIEAMGRAFSDANRYPEDAAPELYGRLSARLGVEPRCILLGAGSNEIIRLIAEAFLSPGDEAVMPVPSFPTYDYAARLASATPVAVPLSGGAVDVPAMAKALTPRTRVAFLCNPNNPTGGAFHAAELDRFMAEAPPGLLVVMDEAYYEYVDDPEYPDSLRYVKDGANVVVLRTFSKVYALAGLRVGYAVSTPGIVRALGLVRQPFNVSTVALAAAAASLDDEEQIRRSRNVNAVGKKLLYGRLKEMGVRFLPTQANFVFIDTGRPAKQVFEAMLRDGVIVRPSPGPGLPTQIRVTVGTQEQNLKMLAALERAVAAIAPAGGDRG